jgi:hypothetical protein
MSSSTGLLAAEHGGHRGRPGAARIPDRALERPRRADGERTGETPLLALRPSPGAGGGRRAGGRPARGPCPPAARPSECAGTRRVDGSAGRWPGGRSAAGRSRAGLLRIAIRRRLQPGAGPCRRGRRRVRPRNRCRGLHLRVAHHVRGGSLCARDRGRPAAARARVGPRDPAVGPARERRRTSPTSTSASASPPVPCGTARWPAFCAKGRGSASATRSAPTATSWPTPTSSSTSRT